MSGMFPQFVEPDRPDLLPIREIHRGHDAWITFHRNDPETGQQRDLWGVRAEELEGIFPQRRPQRERDSFFSVTAFWRALESKRRGQLVPQQAPRGLEPQLGVVQRRKYNLEYLTCCFCDLDCHALGITTGTALGALVDAQDSGALPPASMITRSGRGLWAFWMLRDAKHGGHQKAMPCRIQEWANIQHCIGAKLTAIGADAAARDAVRISRVAGSVNSKSETRVAYWIQKDKFGQTPSYTIDGLLDFFDLKTIPKAVSEVRVDKAKSKLTERARKGQVGRWLKALECFRTLWELRRTWPAGTRNNAAFIYTQILTSLHKASDASTLTAGERWSELLRLLASFDQPAGNKFTERNLKAAVQGVGRPKFGQLGPMRNQTISDWLDVTIEESVYLQGGWPPATKYRADIPEDRAEVEKIDPRQRITIRQLHLVELSLSLKKSKSRLPTLERLAEFLEERGLPTSAATIANDLRELGIRNPRRHKRRKSGRALLRQPKLFE